jgi:hypothetical protein
LINYSEFTMSAWVVVGLAADRVSYAK